MPLLPPTTVGAGVATAESLLVGGEVPDGHRPEARRVLASALARVIELCRPLTAEPGFREHAMATPPDELWPRPHDGRFDFARSAAGAEWIDAVAAAALPPQETGAGVDVVGHEDLRAEHVRLAGGALTAVYDWDSLALRREPVLVGIVAHGFTANWRAPAGHRQFPTLAEMRAYVADYEAARGAPFAADERRMLDASLVYTMAYTARCEHSDAVLDFGRRARPAAPPATVPEGGARAFLAAHAAELLDVDVDAARDPGPRPPLVGRSAMGASATPSPPALRRFARLRLSPGPRAAPPPPAPRARCGTPPCPPARRRRCRAGSARPRSRRGSRRCAGRRARAA